MLNSAIVTTLYEETPLQIKYDINKVQLKMLQITSRHAEQAVTVHCRNIAFSGKELKFHSMKPGSPIRPQTSNNGCSVSVQGPHLNNKAFLSQIYTDGIFSWCQQ